MEKPSEQNGSPRSAYYQQYPPPQPLHQNRAVSMTPEATASYLSITMRLYEQQQLQFQRQQYLSPYGEEVYPTPTNFDMYEDPPTSPRVEGILVGQWEAPLFGCYRDCVPNCWMVTFCPCVALAKALHRMRVFHYSRAWKGLLVLAALELAAIVYETYKSIENGGIDTQRPYIAALNCSSSNDCSRIVTFLTNFYGGAIAMQLIFAGIIGLLRLKVRRWFKLPGNCCADCGLAVVCPCCTLAQITTHVKSYKPGSCSFAEPDVLPPYDTHR